MLPMHRAVLLSDPEADALVIAENNAALGSFDPTITTGPSTSIVWECVTNGYRTTTTGTSHALSYSAPDSSTRRWQVRCAAGLGVITAIDSNADALTDFQGVQKCNLSQVRLHNNASLRLDCNIFSRMNIDYFSFIGNTLCTGVVAAIPRTVVNLYLALSGYSGSIGDAPAVLQIFYAYSTIISASSIAHLVAIRDLRIYNMSWNATAVDTVLLSASDAVWADANHFTYGAPSLLIGGSGGTANAAPGGSAGADTTDPMVTPGSGNSNTDWQWDAGKSAHKALTGKAAVYYLTHLATHTWGITYSA